MNMARTEKTRPDRGECDTHKSLYLRGEGKEGRDS